MMDIPTIFVLIAGSVLSDFLVASVLFFRLARDDIRRWRASRRAGKHGYTSMIDPRMPVMAWTPFAALLMMQGAGFILAGGQQVRILAFSLAACVATFGLVAAGHVVVRGVLVADRLLACFFLLLNAIPVGLAVLVMVG